MKQKAESRKQKAESRKQKAESKDPSMRPLEVGGTGWQTCTINAPILRASQIFLTLVGRGSCPP